MWLYSLSEQELRSFCRSTIENLELWLRRLIDEQLTKSYGSNYLDYQDDSGKYLLNKQIREHIKSRKQGDPSRYHRLIDAALLDDLISIICNPNLYENHFKESLKNAFPNGHEEARTFLRRIADPRNNLSHANPISVRQAEQIICYSNDIIDSLKDFYQSKNMNKLYNVPKIIKMKDSLGNIKDCSETKIPRSSTGGVVSFSNDTLIYPGDSLSIQVDIDPSFDPSTYNIKWSNTRLGKIVDGYNLVLNIEERHVHTSFNLICIVTSNKSWHRFGNYDDRIEFCYKVVPL